jgi:hypothetical protein
MAEPTLEQRISGIRDPGFLLYWAIKCTVHTEFCEKVYLQPTAFILVTLETILRRNRRPSEIKDEAFSRFWRFINRKLPCLITSITDWPRPSP